MLYQSNSDESANASLTPLPTPKLGCKAGLSYEGIRGLTVNLFEVSDRTITSFAPSVNPMHQNESCPQLMFSKPQLFRQTKVGPIAHASHAPGKAEIDKDKALIQR
jgi:hypothetical protein